MEPLETDSYKGVRDFYPNEWARMQTMFATIRQTLARWGYEEYNASPLERAELYEAKTSDEIVSEQTYTFTDRGERRVTLRPEMTPTLARMVAARRRELAFPLRWFSIPNVFRYERPQRGRLREHYQVNVDLVGVASTEADVEIISVASELLRSFGAKEGDFTIRVNSRPLLTAACKAAHLTEETSREYVRLLDKKKKISADEFHSAREALSSEDPLALIEDTSTSPDIEKEKGLLLQTIATLASRGYTNVVFDPTITRGFDYYTGIVFEVFDTNTANARSLFGGGRFDKLVSLFGGEPIPAIGFGMGDVTLADFLETHSLARDTREDTPHVFIGTPTAEDIPAAQSLAQSLREDGVRVFVNLSERSLGDQIKDALKRNIPFFIAYGADEIASHQVKMKTLATSEEVVISEADISAHITKS